MPVSGGGESVGTEGAMQAQTAQCTAQLLAAAQQLLEEHAPPEAAHRFGDALVAAPEDFLLTGHPLLLAANIAAVALAASLKTAGSGSMRAAARLIPGPTPTS
ncbi:hypothetical protein ABPG75_010021 [Micractinium tetrahymenae]